MRKIVTLLLVLVMVSLVIIPTHDIKADVDNTYSVKVGKKITLKTNMKNAVWGSDNVDIATVTSVLTH